MSPREEQYTDFELDLVQRLARIEQKQDTQTTEMKTLREHFEDFTATCADHRTEAVETAVEEAKATAAVTAKATTAKELAPMRALPSRVDRLRNLLIVLVVLALGMKGLALFGVMP